MAGYFAGLTLRQKLLIALSSLHGKNRVPGLADLPVLGRLFESVAEAKPKS